MSKLSSTGAVTEFCNPRNVEQAQLAAAARNFSRKTKPFKVDPTTSEIDYSAEEVEFANALHGYKQRTGRLFPTCRETLGVLRSLGYAKVRASA